MAAIAAPRPAPLLDMFGIGDPFAPPPGVVAPGQPYFRPGTFAEAMELVLAHHYTRRRTADPMQVFVWVIDGKVVAAAVFTSPVNKYFGQGAVELARLVRVPELVAPLSQFVGLCLRWLKANTPLRYCLSYADSTVGHVGAIYQATNFIHVATSPGNTQWRHDHTGRVVSGRSFDQHAADNKAGWSRLRTGRKFLYVYPLGERRKALLARFGWSPLPYPKAATALLT